MVEKKNERITFLVSAELKLKWQEFIEKEKITSISQLARKAVNFYVENIERIPYFDNINKVSHMLKEPLTVINGFSHIILKNYLNKLDPDTALRIKEINEQSKLLEKRIDEIFLHSKNENQKYDILLVDDDAATILILKDFFESFGLICRGIRTGSNCIQDLKANTPKVILIDIMLPDINGFNLCKQIRKMKGFQNKPIYFITAIPETEVIKRMDDTKANGFILKPFDFTAFDPLIEIIHNTP